MFGSKAHWFRTGLSSVIRPRVAARQKRMAIETAVHSAFEPLESRLLLSATAPQTLYFPSFTPANLPFGTTDWTDTQSINQFNPTIGILTEVDVQYSGTVSQQ